MTTGTKLHLEGALFSRDVETPDDGSLRRVDPLNRIVVESGDKHVRLPDFSVSGFVVGPVALHGERDVAFRFVSSLRERTVHECR